MLPGERRQKILELLMINKAITVKYLCDTLEASEATIRRDLATLESEEKLERTHGGAVIADDIIKLNYEENFNQKESKFASKKYDVAKKAFEFLEENDSIILDSGTTTLELARLIGESTIKITVITNATTVSRVISNNPNAELMVVGGKVRLNTLATVGSIAVETLKRFNVNKTFLAVNGVTLENGLTTPDFEEAEVKKTMLLRGVERFLLVDHSKFKKVAMCQIGPVSMVDYIITDQDTDGNIIKQFRSNDIKIIQA
ncbi:MAG TPA: DeoR/GlpR transcriptional regulator [Epulopiscium sp.]|nr:DeoR/GlpR transcriptional regulator [Candidatus Epulonipiscium sp.]